MEENFRKGICSKIFFYGSSCLYYFNLFSCTYTLTFVFRHNKEINIRLYTDLARAVITTTDFFKMHETGRIVAKLWQTDHRESILHILQPSYILYKYNNSNLQNLHDE